MVPRATPFWESSTPVLGGGTLVECTLGLLAVDGRHELRIYMRFWIELLRGVQISANPEHFKFGVGVHPNERLLISNDHCYTTFLLVKIANCL